MIYLLITSIYILAFIINTILYYKALKEKDKTIVEKNKEIFDLKSIEDINNKLINKRDSEILQLKSDNLIELNQLSMDKIDVMYRTKQLIEQIRERLKEEKKKWGGIRKISIEADLSYSSVFKHSTENLPMEIETIEKFKEYFKL